MFNLCTEFTVSGLCLTEVLCPVLFIFITFIFNIFVASELMYTVMIEKKYVMGVFLYAIILLVGTKKNSHAICLKIVKRTSLISKNEPDRN